MLIICSAGVPSQLLSRVRKGRLERSVISGSNAAPHVPPPAPAAADAADTSLTSRTGGSDAPALSVENATVNARVAQHSTLHPPVLAPSAEDGQLSMSDLKEETAAPPPATVALSQKPLVRQYKDRIEEVRKVRRAVSPNSKPPS